MPKTRTGWLRKLWPLVAAAAILAVVASPTSAASIYRGCDPPQWGTYPCWDPANPADVAAMHPCPMWTDRHTPAFISDTGHYDGFVNIRSTVSCKLAHKLMYDQTAGGAGYYPAGGMYWWPGYGFGGRWRQGRKELLRGLHIARTNEPTAPSAQHNWNVHSIMLEHDLITYDIEALTDCSMVPNKAYLPCVNITPASYSKAGIAALAALATATLWLSAPATATEPGLLKATSKDAYAMASMIRGVRTHSSDVKVERQPTTRGGQVIQVFIRARPGAFAKVGVYTLMLLTDRRGRVQLEHVSENRVSNPHYHFGAGGLEENYLFSFDGSSNHQWSIGTTYLAHSRYYSFDWATGRVSGRPPEPHLTLAELEALWKQASAVLKKAIGRAPVSEEEVLHPGYVCNSSSALTNGCKPEG